MEASHGDGHLTITPKLTCDVGANRACPLTTSSHCRSARYLPSSSAGGYVCCCIAGTIARRAFINPTRWSQCVRVQYALVSELDVTWRSASQDVTRHSKHLWITSRDHQGIKPYKRVRRKHRKLWMRISEAPTRIVATTARGTSLSYPVALASHEL